MLSWVVDMQVVANTAGRALDEAHHGKVAHYNTGEMRLWETNKTGALSTITSITNSRWGNVSP